MPSRGQALTISFVVWDNTNNVGKTGDAANFTLRWVKDGTSAAPANVPATEVDATNAPGLYKITLTGTECTCDFGTLAGKSSTIGIAILPISVSFEQLPTAAPNANGGLPILSVSGTTLGYTVTTATLALTQTLGAARALDSIADTALTLNDALHCAIAGAVGKESISGTNYLVQTPSTGTTLRTFALTLNANSEPTARA